MTPVSREKRYSNWTDAEEVVEGEVALLFVLLVLLVDVLLLVNNDSTGSRVAVFAAVADNGGTWLVWMVV